MNILKISKFLEIHNYSSPPLNDYKGNSLEVRREHPSGTLRLFIDGVEETGFEYHSRYHYQAYQYFPQYKLAEGNCICVGLGFGILPNWLLTKENISKITIIEKNKELIEYHKEYIKSPFIEHVEIIHCNEYDYVGECDTLIIDRLFLGIGEEEIFENSKKICNNIKNKNLLMLIGEYYVHLGTFDDPYRQYTEYTELRSKFPTLPDLTKEELLEFISICEYNID